MRQKHSEHISNRKSFLYVDNEGTKFSLMNGSSDNSVVDVLAIIFAEIETYMGASCWIARVSSYSNLADAPSRGDCQLLLKLGFLDVSDLAVACLESLLRCMKGKMGKMAAASSPT